MMIETRPVSLRLMKNYARTYKEYVDACKKVEDLSYRANIQSIIFGITASIIMFLASFMFTASVDKSIWLAFLTLTAGVWLYHFVYSMGIDSSKVSFVTLDKDYNYERILMNMKRELIEEFIGHPLAQVVYASQEGDFTVQYYQEGVMKALAINFDNENGSIKLAGV